MGLDAGGVDLLEEVDGHAEVDVAHALDGEADRVLARIEDAVLAGAVVLELEQVVAVLEGEHVLGFAGVHEFLGHGGKSFHTAPHALTV